MEQLLPQLFPNFQSLGSAAGFAEDIHEIVGQAPLFGDLSFQEVEAMCSFMACYAAPSKSELIREGDVGDFFLIVLTGSVSVVKTDADGNQFCLAKVTPGGILGELSMIDNQPRFASCISDEPVDFAVLTRQALNDILMALPRFGNKLLLILLRVVAARLRKTSCDLISHETLCVV